MLDIVKFNEFRNQSIVTNYYGFLKDIFDSDGNIKFEYRQQDGLIYFIKDSEYSFKRLFFFLNTQKAENNLFYLDTEFHFVSEVIFLDSQIQLKKIIFDWFEKNTYFHYKTFVRMFRNGDVNYSDFDNSSIDVPSIEEIKLIHFELEANFDKFSEKIPTIKELTDLRNFIFIIKVNNEIASILVSELKGKTKELRYWLVLPKYRGRGLGSKLLKYFLNSTNEIVRYTLWVDSSNSNAIEQYKLNGFKMAKVKNYIFINETIMKDKILQILKDTRPEFEFQVEKNFIEEGYLDSFDLITLVSDLESEFEI